MDMALRAVGWTLALVGVAAAVADGLDPARDGFRLRALGEWWFRIAPTSLQLLQPALERHVARWLWDPAALTLLQAPAALLFGGAGATLLAIRAAKNRILTKRR